MLTGLLAIGTAAAWPKQPGVRQAGGGERPAGVQDSLRVFLLTFGPGEAVWERFGHNALWIHDPVAGTDIAYHWGLFDMSEEGFLLEFLRGRMVYSMGDADATRLVNAYRRVGRDVTAQELALTAGQARDLQAFVEWNLRPENRRYRYDYFRDNCSTRVRDALDRVLGGQLRTELEARPTEETYRSEAIDLTANDWLLSTGMDLGLGPLADQPITRWELAYIPMRLRDDVATMTVDRAEGAVPLVVGVRELPALDGASGPPAEVSPAGWVLQHLLIGLLVGGILVGAAVIGFGGRVEGALRGAARWVLGIVGSLWGLVVGVLGLVILGLWTLTDHEFAWRNENLLQVNPLALGLVVLVPLAVARGGSRPATRLAGLMVFLSLFGLFLNPLPVTRQATLAIIAMALPIHLGMFYALWRVEASGAGSRTARKDG